jgi:hypothetical protein
MAALGAELYAVMYKKKTVDFIDKKKSRLLSSNAATER